MSKEFLWIIMSVLCLPASGQPVDVYARPQQSEREPSFDALHYRVQLRIDLDQKRFNGENTIHLIPLVEGFRICWLDASEMEVAGVFGPGGDPLRFKHQGDRLRIRLDRPYSTSDTVVLSVRYRGSDPSDGLFFDDETEDHPKMLSSNSWPDHARYWFPCNDVPDDKATHEMIITVRQPLKVLSNGRLVDIAYHDDSGEVTYHWYQEKPHSTYLSMLAAGPFSILEDSLDHVPIGHWVYPGDEENAARIFACTPGAIDFYSGLFGVPYPWAKYDHVIGPHQGGGAEATSATILGPGVIHDPDPGLDARWERIIAHEIAHQWWGNLITLDSWPETWLNEGFATYFDHVYVTATRGDDEGAVDLMNKKNAYLNEAATRYMRPIVFDRYHHIEENFDRHTYQKAAVSIHLLRQLLGEIDFFRTLKFFLQEYAYNNVNTEDFISAIRSVTGKDMRWFFDQHFYRPGHPVFRIESSWDATRSTLELTIRQVQDTTRGIPVYKVPVTIGIVTDNAKIQEKIWLEEPVEHFAWILDSKPRMVRFDEGNILLKEWVFLKEPEELLYQLRNDDVIGRTWAALELDDHIRADGVTQELMQAAQKDPFWSVRKAALETMVNAGITIPGDLLKNLMNDPHYEVRRLAIKIYESQYNQE
jgi:aminopeptidase N